MLEMACAGCNAPRRTQAVFSSQSGKSRLGIFSWVCGLFPHKKFECRTQGVASWSRPSGAAPVLIAAARRREPVVQLRPRSRVLRMNEQCIITSHVSDEGNNRCGRMMRSSVRHLCPEVRKLQTICTCIRVPLFQLLDPRPGAD